MTKRAIASLLLVVLCALLSTGQTTSTHQQVRQVLQSQYRRFYGAYKRNDYASMSALLAPEFRQRNSDGTVMDRTQMLAEWKQNVAQVKRFGLQLRPTLLMKRLTVVRGHYAFVVGQEQYEADMIGAVKDTQIIEVTSDPVWVRDTWVKSKTGWLLKERTYHRGKP